MDSARDSAPGSENPGSPKILDKNFDFLVFLGVQRAPPWSTLILQSKFKGNFKFFEGEKI